MKNCLIKLAQIIGMDKSIAYSSGSRIIGGAMGVFTVLFISAFLSGIEQGFYYTFGSITALQVFFELGLTSMITQYVAHEVSHLTYSDNYEYKGDQKYKSRLGSLVHFCLKWYAVLSIIVFTFLLVVGFVYFNRYGGSHHEVSWQIPWLLICIGTSAQLFISPFYSIFMGLGKVKEMSKIGFWQQIALPASIWLGLICGLKLYVVGLGSILLVIIWLIYVTYTKLGLIIIKLWKVKITERVVYSKEILPYQWRIALSWISGYFVFQLFNPVLFATEGAVVAGQMGMTLQGLNAVQNLSSSWLTTKIPLYSKLIALKDYVQLDLIFHKTLKQMTAICLTMLCFFFILIWLFNISQLKLRESLLADRFLGYIPLLLLMLPVFLQQFVSSWATYIRCHKKEPFFIISICMALATCTSTFLFGNMFGLYGITIGYCLISVCFFPWWYRIYIIKKIEWHS